MNQNEIKIEVNNFNTNIEYILNEPLKKITRVINENVKLVAEFIPNLFGKSNTFIYVVVSDNNLTTSHILESSFLNKKCSRSDYMEKLRPKIYEYVSSSQILRINLDIKELFEKFKPFKVIKLND